MRNFYNRISIKKSIRLLLHENKTTRSFSDTFLWTRTFWGACVVLVFCHVTITAKTICLFFNTASLLQLLNAFSVYIQHLILLPMCFREGGDAACFVCLKVINFMKYVPVVYKDSVAN